MDVIEVEGGRHIEGSVQVEGAKNSALKLMAATILAPGVNTLTNVPDIADVHVMGKVLSRLGASIEVLDRHTLRIDTSAVDRWVTPYHLVAQMRASTAVLGPLGAGDDPHAHDLCAIHTARMSVPQGWVVVRHETLRA